MTKEFTAPSDKLKVGEHEVFMSYARLLRLTALFPEGLAALAGANDDANLSTVLCEVLLADNGVEPKDYPPLESYNLTISQGEELTEWGLAHAFGFFARKVSSTLALAENSAQTIKEVEETAKQLTLKM